MSQIKDNSKSKIISMFEVRITSLFHATKCASQSSFQPGESVTYLCVKVFSQKVTSVSEVWRTESLIWSASNQCLDLTVSNFFSFPFSRCQIGVLKVCIQSKSGVSLESMKHCKFSSNSFWSKFLNELCQIFFSVRFSRCQIWSSEGLISVKKRLLCRKHDTLQIQFEQRFEQILEIVLSNFLLHSILQMRIRALKGMIP